MTGVAYEQFGYAAWASFAALLISTPVLATDETAIFDAFQGNNCTPLYTVQKTSCELEHVYRCEAEQLLLWRYVIHGPDIGVDIEITNEDGTTLLYHDDLREFGVLNVESMPDPFSLRETLDIGRDSYEVERYVVSYPLPELSVKRGVVTETSDVLEVDGLQFIRLVDTYEEVAESFSFSSKADLYLEPIEGFLLIGAQSYMFDGTTENAGGKPAQVIRPEEPGFLENKPLYGCGVISDAGQTAVNERTSS